MADTSGWPNEGLTNIEFVYFVSWVFGNFFVSASYILEKTMAPYSSTLAWKIPWTEEPGGLQSMGSLRVNWASSLSLFIFMHWRRKRQPTPVLPGESQGRGAWWAAVYGVAQSWTRLKWLSSICIFITSWILGFSWLIHSSLSTFNKLMFFLHLCLLGTSYKFHPSYLVFFFCSIALSSQQSNTRTLQVTLRIFNSSILTYHTDVLL